MDSPVIITISDEGKITNVDFVQWIMNEIDDHVYNQKTVAHTYSILIQKGVSSEDARKINAAIIKRWSASGLKRIKEMAWRQIKNGSRDAN